MSKNKVSNKQWIWILISIVASIIAILCLVWVIILSTKHEDNSPYVVREHEVYYKEPTPAHNKYYLALEVTEKDNYNLYLEHQINSSHKEWTTTIELDQDYNYIGTLNIYSDSSYIIV